MKIAVAYASLSGNTREVALVIESSLKEMGHLVTLYDLLETEADALLKYDLVFVGCSTYDEGLNAIGQMFVDTARVSGHDCRGVKFAIFALGDSTYPRFATAGIELQDELRRMGAGILDPILTLDGRPTEAMSKKVKAWVGVMLTRV